MGKQSTDARGETQRRHEILSILSRSYPDARIALTYRTPWELLVAVILSAQCTDVRVNLVTPNLFSKFPSVESFRDTPIELIETAIKSTGFFHAKAKNIQKSATIIIDRFGGEVPRTMNDMLSLSGVARKTANVVLGNAYGVIEGIAVDTHVIRLSQRLRLVDIAKIGGKIKILVKYPTGQSNKQNPQPVTRNPLNPSEPSVSCSLSHVSVIDYLKDADPTKIEKELMAWIPKSMWMTVTYELIDHGRSICKAISPKCSNCLLSHVCPVSR